MAFSCSNIQQDIQKEESEEKVDPKERQKLKRPYPFPSTIDDSLNDEIIPEAVDVLDSIFTSLCSLSENSSTSNDISIVENTNISSSKKDVEETKSDEIEIIHDNDCTNVSVKTDDQTENVSEPFEEIYDFTNIPLQVTGAWKEFGKGNNYTRGCKW
ncbi:telomerase Cajal body protein 1 [Trichonephila clavipes]|nr:telomerase Cajal body protein 1 [Trichonephila clavipes]